MPSEPQGSSRLRRSFDPSRRCIAPSRKKELPMGLNVVTKKSIRPRFRHLQAIQARQRQKQDKESKYFTRRISTLGLKEKIILESEICNKELDILRPNASSDRSS